MVSVAGMFTRGVDERVEDAFQLCFQILPLYLAGVFSPKRIREPLDGVEYAELMSPRLLILEGWVAVAPTEKRALILGLVGA
jgi:hypothetical protein